MGYFGNVCFPVDIADWSWHNEYMNERQNITTTEEIQYIGQYKLIPADQRIFGDYDSQAWNTRYGKARDAGLPNCEACGRGVAEGKGFWVNVVEGGMVLAADQWEAWENDETVDHSGDMGDGWILGPECGKKLPAEFRRAR